MHKLKNTSIAQAWFHRCFFLVKDFKSMLSTPDHEKVVVGSNSDTQ